MLEHWLIELIGHVSGLSDAQLKQIEKSLCLSKRCKQIAAGAALGLANSPAHSADHIRVAAQITGTLSWEGATHPWT